MDLFMKKKAIFSLVLFFTLCLYFLIKVSLVKEPRFIFIAGGSASGKTTLAKTLVSKLGTHQASYISLDDYLDKRIQPEIDYIDGIPNFDNPSMINWNLLIENISDLQNGKSINIPIYDFSSWIPVAFKHLDWKPIIIIEGIHATQDQLDSFPGLRVFIDVDRDLRYQRRLVRDVNERNYSTEMSKKIFLDIAVPNQKIFLDPTSYKANIMIKNFDGEEDLEIASTYVIDILERFKPFEYKNLWLKINDEQYNLVSE